MLQIALDYIRTDFEKLFEIGLQRQNIKYRIGCCYCFTCHKVFNWTRSEAPEKCPIGRHDWTEPGQFARPDFLIYIDDKLLACVRIDGPVHDKKTQRIKDRFQAQSFLDDGIKVFVIRNEWLLGAQHIIYKKSKKWLPIQFPNWVYESMALNIWLCCLDNTMYRKYLSDKEVKHYLGLKNG